MKSYRDRLKIAKDCLNRNEFDLCSIFCRKILELLLKDILEVYLSKADNESKQKISDYLAARKKSIDQLRTGDAVYLFEKAGLLEILANREEISFQEIRLVNLRAMLNIGNHAAHQIREDTELDIADAYIIYGSMLRLVRLFSPLLDIKSANRKQQNLRVSLEIMSRGLTQNTGQPREAKRFTVDERPLSFKTEISDETSLTLCKNKSSGKHFIFLEEEGVDKLLLITPKEQIRALGCSLFEDPVEMEAAQSMEQGLVSKGQLEMYHKYVEEDFVPPKPDRNEQPPKKNQGVTQKNPTTNLKKLVDSGLLDEGQKLYFRHNGRRISDYTVTIFDGKLLWRNKLYSMSKLAGLALDGLGLDGESVRGPLFWYTDNGDSIKELWEEYLHKQSASNTASRGFNQVGKVT